MSFKKHLITFNEQQNKHFRNKLKNVQTIGAILETKHWVADHYDFFRRKKTRHFRNIK